MITEIFYAKNQIYVRNFTRNTYRDYSRPSESKIQNKVIVWQRLTKWPSQAPPASELKMKLRLFL